MEVYKMGKIIENQEIEVHLILHQLNEAKDALKSSLKRRKEIAIAEMTHNTKRLTPQRYLQKVIPMNLM